MAAATITVSYITTGTQHMAALMPKRIDECYTEELYSMQTNSTKQSPLQDASNNHSLN
jgi:hypothetical protein